MRCAGAVALGVALAAVAVAGAAKRMDSTRLAPGLCETTGGGRFVAIPGFPGERIDRRLLTDIRLLERRYSILITDGYSLDPIHAANGEHPLGLALDIVPNQAAGGTWADIDRLARWAEPRQDRPRQPFRWVGYDGDRGHGRGNHLHLSWSHSVATRGPGHPVRSVFTIRCPGSGVPPGPGPGNGSPNQPPRHPPGGGIRVGGGRGGGADSGGVGAKPRLAPPAPESGGVRARG